MTTLSPAFALQRAIARFDEAAGTERGGYPREFAVRDAAEALLAYVCALEAKLAAVREILARAET